LATYTNDMVYPTLDFPSDHAVFSLVLSLSHTHTHTQAVLVFRTWVCVRESVCRRRVARYVQICMCVYAYDHVLSLPHTHTCNPHTRRVKLYKDNLPYICICTYTFFLSHSVEGYPAVCIHVYIHTYTHPHILSLSLRRRTTRCVHICVHIYVYTHILYMYTHTYSIIYIYVIYMYIHTCMYVCVCTHIYVHIYIYIHIYVYTHIAFLTLCIEGQSAVHICTHIYVYIYTYSVYIFVYTYT